MTNAKNFRVGTPVTWGSGAPRAKIVQFNYDHPEEPWAEVILTETVHGACGMAFPAGRTACMPLSELRLIS